MKTEKKKPGGLRKVIKPVITVPNQAEIDLAKQAEIDRLSVEDWFNLANDL